MTDYSITVLENAVQVMEILLDGNQPMTLAQLTQKSGFSKNKVFRILHTLENHSYVERDDSGAYRLGVRFLDYGFRVQQSMRLLDVSPPVMAWLAQETAETIFLGIIDGDEVLCVDARESSHSVRLSASVGKRLPIYAGGVPRILLAFMPDDDRDQLLERLEFVPLTSHTIVEHSELIQSLADVRRLGYVVAVGDLDDGAHSIAAPIRDHRGRVVAAVSVAGPSRRFEDETIERTIALILEGAARISQGLGYRADPDGIISDPACIPLL